MQTDKNEILYHYTTQAGLLGILKSKHLWCSHYAYLNDASEYRYAETLYRRALEEIISDVTSAPNMKEYAIASIYWLGGSMIKDGERVPPSPPQYYVCSFSEKHDDLSQWRGYSSQGSRFCIGFDVEALRACCTRSNMEFHKVSYAGDGVKDVMRREFLNSMQRIEKSNELWAGSRNGRPALEGHPGTYTVNNYTIISQLGLSVKNEKFSEEEEWRVSTKSAEWDKINYREGRSFVIPYCQLPLCTKPDDPKDCLEEPLWTIKKVIIGPCSNPDLSRRSVEQLLSRYSWQSVSVELSKVPYRDW